MPEFNLPLICHLCLSPELEILLWHHKRFLNPREAGPSSLVLISSIKSQACRLTIKMNQTNPWVTLGLTRVCAVSLTGLTLIWPCFRLQSHRFFTTKVTRSPEHGDETTEITGQNSYKSRNSPGSATKAFDNRRDQDQQSGEREDTTRGPVGEFSVSVVRQVEVLVNISRVNGRVFRLCEDLFVRENHQDNSCTNPCLA